MQATAASSSVIEVSAHQLNAHGSLYCPNPQAGMEVWNSHPRVYLDLAHSGTARCPYCGTQYRLQAGAAGHGH